MRKDQMRTTSQRVKMIFFNVFVCEKGTQIEKKKIMFMCLHIIARCINANENETRRKTIPIYMFVDNNYT